MSRATRSRGVSMKDLYALHGLKESLDSGMITESEFERRREAIRREIGPGLTALLAKAQAHAGESCGE